MSAAGQTILVTGAAGFIGSAVAHHLAHDGHVVRAGQRRNAVTTAEGVEPVPCDLNQPEAVRAALDGVSLVVHAAYGASERMAQQCRHLLDAMAQQSVRSLIYVSSVAVYGDREGTVSEDADLSGPLPLYGAAKRDCEALVRAWAAADPDRRALILRPGIVYGRGSPFWIDKLAARIWRGAWGDFGRNGEGIAALVHVDDVATFAANAVRSNWTGCHALHVVGPETPTWNAYFASLASAIGAPPLQPVSAASLALRQALAVSAKIWHRLKLPGLAGIALAPTRGELALFRRRGRYDTAAAEAFGFQPTVGLTEGLRRSVKNPGTGPIGRAQETRPVP